MRKFIDQQVYDLIKQRISGYFDDDYEVNLYITMGGTYQVKVTRGGREADYEITKSAYEKDIEIFEKAVRSLKDDLGYD